MESLPLCFGRNRLRWLGQVVQIPFQIPPKEGVSDMLHWEKVLGQTQDMVDSLLLLIGLEMHLCLSGSGGGGG